MAQCGACVPRLYKNVIDEVVSNIKELFLDEGLDEAILNDLKQSWENKLRATKATEHLEMGQPQGQQPAVAPIVSPMALVPVQITVPTQPGGNQPNKTITIHVPSAALASGVAGGQLQVILSSPAAAQTFALEASQAAEVIQRQLNTALQQNGVALPARLLQYNHLPINQVDGPVCQPLGFAQESKYTNIERQPSSSCNETGTTFMQACTPCMKESSSSSYDMKAVTMKAPTHSMDAVLLQALMKSQVDGAMVLGDSSEEISDDDDDDDDDEEDKDKKKEEEEEDEDDEVEEEEESFPDDPLNSDDDVNDEIGDVFETENVVVCQYDKVNRVRNKWKFHLKDGIMHLKNKDFVFTKATGEAEW